MDKQNMGKDLMSQVLEDLTEQQRQDLKNFRFKPNTTTEDKNQSYSSMKLPQNKIKQLKAAEVGTK
jgi:hypothetical protein